MVALASGGVLFGCKRRGSDGATLAGAGKDTALAFSAWIRIDEQGQVYFYLDRVEMGQGTWTSHAMMVAEELNMSPTALIVEHAPPGKEFKNDSQPLPIQITGGSTSVAESWEPLRRAAATTRENLAAAAVKKYGVERRFVQIANGKILVNKDAVAAHGFGEVVADLRSERLVLQSVGAVEPKAQGAFALLGKSTPRLDVPAKVAGKATFGIDVQLDGMLNCLVVHSPYLRGQPGPVPAYVDAGFLAKFKLERVFMVVASPGAVFRGGIAFCGKHYWHCLEAAREVEARGGIDWPPPPLAVSDKSLYDTHTAKLKEPGFMAGLKQVALETHAAVKVTPTLRYTLPHLPHQTMEPMNCTVDYQRSGAPKLRIWTGTQLPAGAREIARQMIQDLTHEDIEVNTTFMGGGFGRRITQDYVGEAIYVARELQKPVKVTWTREDDIRHDFFGPATSHAIEGGLNDKNEPVMWRHKMVHPSILKHVARDFTNALLPDFVSGRTVKFMGHVIENATTALPGADFFSYEGATGLPYDIREEVWCKVVPHDPEVPIGFWRSVSHVYTAFVVETFVDELATLAGEDPVGFRQNHIRDAKQARLRAVLAAVARESGYGQRTKRANEGWGVACHPCFGSFAAAVVRVAVNPERKLLRVLDVWAAADCGFVLHPDNVKAQIEGGVVFGLSAALTQRITIANGAVQQSNFHDCEILRYHQTPDIHATTIESSEEPSGIGEVAVPVIAPALANAFFAATGKRVRDMPLLASTGYKLGRW
jgi:CO/xanthine dehydrogenase Mo-binding subunit